MPKILVVEVEPTGECKKTQYKSFISRGFDLYFLIASEKYRDMYLPNVRVVSELTTEAFIAEASRWNEVIKFDAVATMSEWSVIATASIAANLGLLGIEIESAKISRNKYLMRQAHHAHGVAHPAFSFAINTEDAVAAAEQIGYPVVIKPTLGGSSEHIYKIDNTEQMRARFPEALHGARNNSLAAFEPRFEDKGPDGIIIEAYLNGSEHSLEAFVWNSQLHICAIGDRLSPEGDLFDNDIYTMPTRLDGDQIARIHDLVEKAARAQGIRSGVLHPEIRYHNGVPYLVEMGARAGGGPISHMTRCAYDYCAILSTLDISLGNKPDQPELKPSGKVVVAIAMICDHGLIENIEEPKELLSSPDIIYFKLFLGKGDMNLRPPYGNMLMGQICASGISVDQAYRAADLGFKSVKVTLSHTNP